MTYKAELNAFIAAKARNDNFERRATIGNARITNELRHVRNMILAASREDIRVRMNARFPINPRQNADALIRRAREFLQVYKQVAMTLKRTLPRNLVTKILRNT